MFKVMLRLKGGTGERQKEIQETRRDFTAESECVFQKRSAFHNVKL